MPQADQLRAVMARWQDAEGDVCVPGELVTALEAVTQTQRRDASASVLQRLAGRAAATSLAYAVDAPGIAGWPPAGDEAWRSASSHGSEGPSPTAAPQSTVAVPYVGYEDDQPRSARYEAAGRGRRGDSGWRIRRRKPHSPVSEIARGCVAMAAAGLYALYGGIDGAFSAVVLVLFAVFGLAVVIRGVRRLVRSREPSSARGGPASSGNVADL